MSGIGIKTLLSNPPDLNSASSITSILLVAPMTITPLLSSKPSICVKSSFRVDSLSSFLIPPLAFPTASISSIKIIEGAFAFA